MYTTILNSANQGNKILGLHPYQSLNGLNGINANDTKIVNQFLQSIYPKGKFINAYQFQSDNGITFDVVNAITFQDFPNAKQVGTLDNSIYKRVYIEPSNPNQKYIDAGTIYPIYVPFSQVASSTPPNTTITSPPVTTTDDGCPCNCNQVQKKITLYLNSTQVDSNDKTVIIKRTQTVCKSTQSQKTYKFDCSAADLNNKLNTSGLSGGLSDCPCDCSEQLIDVTYYLSEKQTTGSIPIDLIETSIVCDANVQLGKKSVDCDEIKKALQTKGYNLSGIEGYDYDQANSLSGLKDNTGVDYTKYGLWAAAFVGAFLFVKYI